MRPLGVAGSNFSFPSPFRADLPDHSAREDPSNALSVSSDSVRLPGSLLAAHCGREKKYDARKAKERKEKKKGERKREKKPLVNVPVSFLQETRTLLTVPLVLSVTEKALPYAFVRVEHSQAPRPHGDAAVMH